MIEIFPLVAAAGKGSRSGLDYPKSLYSLKGRPIIVRILDNLIQFFPKVGIIISSQFKDNFINTIESFGYKYHENFEFIYQDEPLGMGDAILKFVNYPEYENIKNILLQWGDIPYIKKETVMKLIDEHTQFDNDFTFVTAMSDYAYTKVIRDAITQDVVEVIETRELGLDVSSGERDIGLFIFNKDLVLTNLKDDLTNKHGPVTGEHSFLYIIKHLVLGGNKVIAINIADNKELISFNSISDIEDSLSSN